MTDTAVEKVEGAAEDVGVGSDNGNGNLAKKLLIPAAAVGGTVAATLAARKAPDLFRNHVMPKVEEKGADEVTKIGEKAAGNLQGEGGVLGAVAGKAKEKLGGGGGGGREKTRRLPIQRWTDISLPVADVYEKWVDFDEYPKFMHRVLSVEKKDDNIVAWSEKIWFSTRQWEAEITDQRKNDRVAWKTTKGTSHAGVVSFHKLDTNLTRVLVTMDFRPSGILEKMASGMRFVKRAVQADLARFKAYCEMGDAEGLEYVQEEKKDEDKKDEDSDGGDENGKQQSRSNGSSNQASSEDSDTEELEQSRKERAERRKARQS
jgi:uncharacterized membrane protein